MTMDHRTRLREIAAFLKPYQRIWENEIMLQYPEPVKDYPEEWLNELFQIRDTEQLIRLEKKEVEGILHGADLLGFYQAVAVLSSVPSAPSAPAMPENHYTFLHVIPKKQHEIRTLAPAVKLYADSLGVQRVVDIGGGIGLLAQTLNNQYGLKVTSLDMDQELQKTGFQRHQKNAKDPQNMVSYHPVKISAENKDFLSLLGADTLTVGLHTCGELANHQIKASVEAGIKGMINFGCCYQRLEDLSTQNISEFAKSMPERLEQNQFALTLAARAHRKMDMKDRLFMQKVKHYRYSIHMLLTDHYGLKNVLNLGNSPRKLYDAPFSEYASEQLRRIGLDPLPAKKLDEYYENPERQALIWKMLSAAFIRNSFGRLLELYLLLDRVIYLEEKGYKAQLLEFFDEEKSPRNLGIVGLRHL